MKKIISKLLLIAVVISFGVPQALADKGKGRGHGKGEGYEDSERHRSSGHDDDTVTISIAGHDRDLIAAFISDDHRRHCPPGLAKKNNGCLPPGQAKKYHVGAALPDDVVALPLPEALLKLLNPAPQGYQYVQVDKDVLLMAEAGKKVIDAVTLLSAVGE